MSEEADALEELEANDRSTLRERAQRVLEVNRFFPIPEQGIGLMLPDVEAGLTLHEAQLAYINGLWIATILTSLAAIERHVAMVLTMAGDAGAHRLNVKSLVRKAVRQNLLTQTKADEFARLADLRNQYAHLRVPSRLQSITIGFADPPDSEKAQSEDGLDLNLELQRDATIAIQLASSYFWEMSDRGDIAAWTTYFNSWRSSGE